MADITKDDVVKFIENMSVLELSNLVKELEEKFGVSAAAVAMAAPPAGTAAGVAEQAKAEEKTEQPAAKPEKKKPPLLLIIIIVVAGLAIGGGGDRQREAPGSAGGLHLAQLAAGEIQDGENRAVEEVEQDSCLPAPPEPRAVTGSLDPALGMP